MENIMKKKKRILSTFEKEMQDPEWKKEFEKGYESFLLSEFLHEVMEENNMSVRKLSKESGVSTTFIQNLRSEKSENISLKKLIDLLSVLNYHIKFEKNILTSVH